jgi:phosphoribosyl 1,2-cyclic phosphate phosphodiesterase
MNSGLLEFTVLGSGTSTGVPVIGCRCAVCRSALPQNQRTRCSALLRWEGRTVLIDTATDFRQQALRENVERVDAVLFTHTHADHLHGIDDLRTFTFHGATVPVYGSAAALDTIRRVFSYIFIDESEPGYRPRLSLHAVTTSFSLFNRDIVPVPLVHGHGEAFGYRIGKLAYLTDCSAIPEGSLALLNDLEVLVIDALRFTAHASHLNIAGAVASSRTIGARRTLLTHLSHEIDHFRHSAGLPAGVEFAYDGQKLRVPFPG